MSPVTHIRPSTPPPGARTCRRWRGTIHVLSRIVIESAARCPNKVVEEENVGAATR